MSLKACNEESEWMENKSKNTWGQKAYVLFDYHPLPTPAEVSMLKNHLAVFLSLCQEKLTTGSIPHTSRGLLTSGYRLLLC